MLHTHSISNSNSNSKVNHIQTSILLHSICTERTVITIDIANIVLHTLDLI